MFLVIDSKMTLWSVVIVPEEEVAQVKQAAAQEEQTLILGAERTEGKSAEGHTLLEVTLEISSFKYQSIPL